MVVLNNCLKNSIKTWSQSKNIRKKLWSHSSENENLFFCNYTRFMLLLQVNINKIY